MPRRPRAPRTEGSTPLWPGYIPDQYTTRTLAILRRDGTLLTEQGEVCAVPSFAALAEALYALNALAFAGKMEETLAPWLPAILAETKATRENREGKQWCELLVQPDSQQIIGVAIHRGAKIRKLMSASLWGGAPASPELLRDLRDLFTLCRVGDHGTPAALGHAKMVEQWRGKKDWPRHHRPPSALVSRMQAEAVGARRETYTPTQVYAEAWELDRTNGYAAEVHQLPLGTTRYLRDATKWLLPDAAGNVAIRPWAWWGRCRVQIKADMAAGTLPLAVWNEETEEWDWPTRAGWYDCYLWSFEAAELDRLRHEDGAPVVLWSIAEAWYWDGYTSQLGEWAVEMDALRHIAKGPDMRRPEVAALVKCAIVGAIGRLGMEYAHYSVITEEEATAEDTAIVSPDMPETGLYLRREPVDMGTPKHWQCYILSRMNFNVYQQMRELRAEGREIVAVNTDGIWLAADPGRGVEPAAARLGEYKRRYHGEYLAAPARGIVLTPEKVTTPGMPLVMRQQIMRGDALDGLRRARLSASGELHAGARDVIALHLERLRRYYLGLDDAPYAPIRTDALSP